MEDKRLQCEQQNFCKVSENVNAIVGQGGGEREGQLLCVCVWVYPVWVMCRGKCHTQRDG